MNEILRNTIMHFFKPTRAKTLPCLSLLFSWIFSSLPVNKQMLALSATYPESLAQHLTRYMREPTFVRLNPSDMGLKGKTPFSWSVLLLSLPHKAETKT